MAPLVGRMVQPTAADKDAVPRNEGWLLQTQQVDVAQDHPSFIAATHDAEMEGVDCVGFRGTAATGGSEEGEMPSSRGTEICPCSSYFSPPPVMKCDYGFAACAIESIVISR